MADKFKEFQKRFKAGNLKMLANPPPVPGPGGLLRAAGSKVVKEVVKKAAQPRPAKDLKQSNPKDLRNKALREANKLASEAAKAKGPSKKSSYTPAPMAPRISRPGQAGFIGPTRPTSSDFANRLKEVEGRFKDAEKSYRSAMSEKGYQKRQIEKVKKQIAAASGPKTRGLTRGQKITATGAGILAGGGIAGAIYASSSGTIAKAKGGGPVARQGRQAPSMSRGGGPRSRQGSQAPSMKAGPIMPTVSMAGGGVNKPEAKKGVNQFDIAKKNAAAKGDKKKAGATTDATPATTKATPKRRTNLERMRRRQAERFAISSSGRPL